MILQDKFASGECILLVGVNLDGGWLNSFLDCVVIEVVELQFEVVSESGGSFFIKSRIRATYKHW